MKRKLIVYGSGGLCNRLRPMASAIELAYIFDRELLIFWNKEPHCTVPFQNLFDATQWNIINADEFKALGYDYNIPILMSNVKEYQRNMSIKYSWENVERKMLASSQENVLYMSNDFDDRHEQESHRNLRNFFSPRPEIQERIYYIAGNLNIDKETIGIHARGTDMSGVSYEWYKERVQKLYGNHQLFLSTESQDYFNQFTRDFPYILTAPDTIYARKQQAGGWKHNLNMPEESMVHSVIDLFLLARTNIQVAWPHSSFAKVARIIGEKYE